MLKHLSRTLIAVPAAAFLALPCLAAAHARHASGSSHATPTHRSSHAAHARHAEYAERTAPMHHDVTPGMDPDRATAIQSALIREGYLTGQPSGVWDADSIAAMQKLQDANGWQTKYTPDSRALVKLGLGGAPLPSAQAAPVTEAGTVIPAAQP